MAQKKKKTLAGFASRRDIRPALTAADPAAWVPNDEDPIRDHFINAQAWEDIRISIQEVGPNGEGTGPGTRVCFQLLMGVLNRDTDEEPNCAPATLGKHWIPFAECCLDQDCQTELFVVDGHDISVRVTALSVDTGGADIFIFATGGTRLQER